MIVIGLTGSIGMGKSTAASMLERLGVPVHDSDAEVHELLRPGQAGALAVAEEFPYYSYPEIYAGLKDGLRPVDRKKLGELVFRDDAARLRLEAALHPLVREGQAAFIRKQAAMGRKMIALDIPLLFETGAETGVDFTITMTAPHFIQRRRVMAREGMDEGKFRAILARQTPDGEKRARADFVVHTGLGRAYTMRQLKAVLRVIKARTGDAGENEKTEIPETDDE